jgi:hypothetical protein
MPERDARAVEGYVVLIKAIEDACLQLGRHDHWDSTMQRGAGCPVCIDQRAVKQRLRDALAALAGGQGATRWGTR